MQHLMVLFNHPADKQTEGIQTSITITFILYIDYKYVHLEETFTLLSINSHST